MLLYVIVDAASCDPVTTGIAAARSGAHFVQLRDFRSNDPEYVATAKAILAGAGDSKTRLIVSERPHLVQRIGAHGVHIGETYRDIQTAREEIGEGPILGVSQFTPEFIAEHLGEDFPVDYLSVGPVWTTVSKANAGDAIGVAEAAVRANANPYVSALIGGITAANVGELKAALSPETRAMAVVLGEVCRAADPGAAVTTLLRALA